MSRGQDGSWILALHVAAHRGLHFGSQIAWQYGPFGFLTVPRLTYVAEGWLSVTYATLVQLGLAGSLLWAARRALPLWGALPLTVAALCLFPVTTADDQLSAAAVTVALIWALAAFDRDHRPRWLGPSLYPAAAGCLTGLEVLIRLNAGLTILLVCLCASAFAFSGQRTRALTTFAVAFGLTLLFLLLAAGQAVSELPTYVSRSFELISGYSQALGTEERGGLWEYYALVPVALIVVGGSFRATRQWQVWRRTASGLVLSLFLYSAFKQGFVRHDDAHAQYFFASALGAGFGVAGLRPGRVHTAVSLILLTGLLYTVVTPSSARWAGLGHVFTPVASLRTVNTQFGQLRHSRQSITRARTALRRTLSLEPRTIAALGRHTVHVWPVETAVIWAYPSLRWQPLPIFHPNLAYTSALDRANAEFVESVHAPERILLGPASTDSVGEAPATRFAVFCRYAPGTLSPNWLVLVRIPNRCSGLRLIQTVRTSTRGRVSIPALTDPRHDEIVVMQFHGLQPSLLERLATVLYKGIGWRLKFGHNSAVHIAAATERGPYLARIDPRLDYPPPFAFFPRGRTVRVFGQSPIPKTGQRRRVGPRALKVLFFAVHLKYGHPTIR